jgi:branched-chain amino acid transport system ATP-binding protein
MKWRLTNKQNGEPARSGRIGRKMSNIILETEGLTKEFRGFTAVSDLHLQIREGTVHALIGPNGAGKTTVFNLLTKFLSPTSGAIRFRGKDITHSRPASIARQGIVRSFQISAVFPHMTVRENVKMALQRRRADSFYFWRSARCLRPLDDLADELVASVGLTGHELERAVELPYGRKRALEFATTIALNPHLLLLDEPMAGLGQEDIARISTLIRKASGSRTVILVEHNLSVVADLSDRISVLARGKILAEGDYATVSQSAVVQEAYMGTGDA